MRQRFYPQDGRKAFSIAEFLFAHHSASEVRDVSNQLTMTVECLRDLLTSYVCSKMYEDVDEKMGEKSQLRLSSFIQVMTKQTIPVMLGLLATCGEGMVETDYVLMLMNKSICLAVDRLRS